MGIPALNNHQERTFLLDEPITLRQASEIYGISKRALLNYTNLEDDPLPSTVDESGCKHVTIKDCDAFFKRHPEYGKSSRKPIDRAPVGGGTPGSSYITINEAAEASGYTMSAIRNMIKRARNPLPTEKNVDGYYLLDADLFWKYIEAPGIEMAEDEPTSADFSLYPELAALEGTFQPLNKVSSALGIPTKLIVEFTIDPVNPLPYLSNGKRVYINKNRLPDYLKSREVGAGNNPKPNYTDEAAQR